MFTMYIIIAIVLSILFVLFCLCETTLIQLMVRMDRGVAPVCEMLNAKRLTWQQAYTMAYHARINYLTRTGEWSKMTAHQRMFAERDIIDNLSPYQK